MKQKLGLKLAKKIASAKGGKCLSQSYSDANSHLSWECKRGHKWKSTLASIKNQGTWCVECHYQELKAENKRKLIEKLRSFVKKFNRIPKRREFDHFEKNNGSASTAAKEWGSYNKFIKENGFTPNSGIFGSAWREWEKMVGEILCEIYPNRIIYRAYHDKKTGTIVDYYLPELQIAVDAKTSNYEIEARTKQYLKYLKTYKKVYFYCIWKDASQKELKGVKYVYSDTLIERVTSKSIKKKIKLIEIKGNEYRKRFNLILKEDVIKQIKILSKEIGRTPKMKDFSRDPRFTNHTTISNIFGSWTNAIKESGLRPSRTFVSSLSRKEAIQEFKRTLAYFFKNNGRYPNQKDSVRKQHRLKA